MDKVFCLEVDFKEAHASLTTKCDNCAAVLGAGYARAKDCISLMLKDGKDESGYDKYKTFDFCDEECLKEFLNKRAGEEVEDDD